MSLPRFARVLIVSATVALSGILGSHTAQSTPVPAAESAPAVIDAAGCWVESDGEPMSGPLSLMPVDAGTVDCRDLPGWYSDADDAVTVDPEPNAVTFECRPFHNGYVACAPDAGPHGEAPTMPVQEDSSRGYADGWAWDAEDGLFRQSM